MIDHREVMAYLLIGILTFLIFSVGILTYDSPDFSVPDLPDEEVTFEPDPPDPPEQRSSSGLNFDAVITILLIIVGIIIAYFVVNAINAYRQVLMNRRGKGTKSDKISMQRRKLEDARSKAYEILEKGLANSRYTKSYIAAYIALDEGLEHFREIRRPKHITPKEYAFSVDKPVFQASVFRIVNTYYDLRYGLFEASGSDLKQFIKSLDNLFLDEVSKDLYDKWQSQFENVIASDYQTLIPRIQDHTRPGGKL